MFQTARQQWAVNTQESAIAGQLLVRFPESGNLEAIYERGLAIAQKFDDKKERAFCLQQLGRQVAHRVVREEGLALLEQSLESYREVSEPFYAAEVLDELGWGYSLFGYLDKCNAAIQESLTLRRQIGDKIGAANVLRNIATTDWRTRGHQSKLLTYLAEARQLSYELHDRTSLAWTDLIMTTGFFTLGDLDQGSHYLDEGYTVAFDIQVRVLMALALIATGMKHMMQQDYTQALQRLEEGMQYDNPENPDAALIAFTTITYTLANIALGNFEAARQYMRRIVNLRSTMFASFGISAASWFIPTYIMLLDHDGAHVEAIQVLSMMLAYPYHNITWVNEWPPMVELQARIREALGDDAYETAWEAGKTKDINQFIVKFVEELRANNV
jgi:tetratricopeptide (TPR) repeat protein